MSAPRSSPTISVIIPCRNEASSIESAIASLVAQDHPLDDIEVVVVDGGSTDDTANVAKAALADAAFARGEVIANAVGTTPSNLNAGLRWARGDLVVRLDARSRFPSDYVRRVSERFGDSDIAVVGGSQVAVPPSDDTTGRAIARSLNNRFGMGLARYRRAGASSGPVDTVYLGSFRRQQLEEAGGWDESFITNQDFELNQRMQRYGQVWFEAELPVGYVPRGSLPELWRQYHRFGRAKGLIWATTGQRPNGRQMILMVGPAALGLVGLVALRRAPLAATMAGVGVLGAIDHHGAAASSAPGRVRAVAGGTSTLIGMAWWTGVARGLLRPEPRSSTPTR